MTVRDHRQARALTRQVMREEHLCWLCSTPVDKTLPRNHRMAGTADHIIPIAHGGDPYDRTNVRLAHRTCNSSRQHNPPAASNRSSTGITRQW